MAGMGPRTSDIAAMRYKPEIDDHSAGEVLAMKRRSTRRAIHICLRETRQGFSSRRASGGHTSSKCVCVAPQTTGCFTWGRTDIEHVVEGCDVISGEKGQSTTDSKGSWLHPGTNFQKQSYREVRPPSYATSVAEGRWRMMVMPIAPTTLRALITVRGRS